MQFAQLNQNSRNSLSLGLRQVTSLGPKMTQLLGGLVNLTHILSMATQPNLCSHDVIAAANFSCNRLSTFKTDSGDGNFLTRALVNGEQVRISINNRDYVNNYQDVAFGRLNLACLPETN